jgi:hypothetical protein
VAPTTRRWKGPRSFESASPGTDSTVALANPSGKTSRRFVRGQKPRLLLNSELKELEENANLDKLGSLHGLGLVEQLLKPSYACCSVETRHGRSGSGPKVRGNRCHGASAEGLGDLGLLAPLGAVSVASVNDRAFGARIKRDHRPDPRVLGPRLVEIRQHRVVCDVFQLRAAFNHNSIWRKAAISPWDRSGVLHTSTRRWHLCVLTQFLPSGYDHLHHRIAYIQKPSYLCNPDASQGHIRTRDVHPQGQ